jgi:hypothetical protein
LPHSRLNEGIIDILVTQSTCIDPYVMSSSGMIQVN